MAEAIVLHEIGGIRFPLNCVSIRSALFVTHFFILFTKVTLECVDVIKKLFAKTTISTFTDYFVVTDVRPAIIS